MIRDNDISDRVSKLISNLGHFCEARELDFIMLVQQGVSCWRAEMEADDFVREFTAKLILMPANRKRRQFIKL